MTPINFSLTHTEQNSGWELKYTTKNGIQCKNLSLGKIIELSKHNIRHLNHRWRVSVFNKDGSIDDTDKLKKTEAFELAHTLMNA